MNRTIQICRCFLTGALFCIYLLTGTDLAIAVDYFAGQSLLRHQASGRLTGGVKQQLDRTGLAEVLVVLNADDAREEASHLRRARNSSTDTDEIVRHKDRLLRQKKERLLSTLSPLTHGQRSDFEHFPVLHLNVSETALAKLLDDPAVARVQENRRHRYFLAQSLPLIGQPQVQSRGYAGAGTAVAVLDTGVDYTRSAFGSCSAPGVPASCKVAYAQDIAPSDGMRDADGHGTNVAGIVVGAAPDTKIIALDVFLGNGAYDSDLLTALDWVLTNRSTYNIVAVNMSLGGESTGTPCGDDVLAGPVADLKDAGILSAIASGNEVLTGAIASPACVPAAVSVGAVYDSAQGIRAWSGCTDATTAADQVTCFTNVADFLTLLAPGAMITAADRTYGGTSQAAPHVAGAMAVIKAAQPALTADEIIARLTGTGTTVSVTRQVAGAPITFLKPRLNLDAALKPRLTVAPLSYNFGNLPLGSPGQSTVFTVTNAGTSDLVIGSTTLGGPDGSLFSLLNDDCSGQTLPSTTYCTISVSHQALATGSRTAILTIPSNDPVTPSQGIPLSALDGTAHTLSVAVTGNGSINSVPTGISCGIVCNAPFLQGTMVILTPNPAPDSYFAGWTGGCSGTGACQPTIIAPTVIGAAFALYPPVRGVNLATVYYPSLTAAYAAAADGEILQLKAGALSESLLFNRPVAVTIRGGYDGSYSVMTGWTTISGDLAIADGMVTVEGVILQ